MPRVRRMRRDSSVRWVGVLMVVFRGGGLCEEIVMKKKGGFS